MAFDVVTLLACSVVSFNVLINLPRALPPHHSTVDADNSHILTLLLPLPLLCVSDSVKQNSLLRLKLFSLSSLFSLDMILNTKNETLLWWKRKPPRAIFLKILRKKLLFWFKHSLVRRIMGNVCKQAIYCRLTWQSQSSCIRELRDVKGECWNDAIFRWLPE